MSVLGADHHHVHLGQPERLGGAGLSLRPQGAHHPVPAPEERQQPAGGQHPPQPPPRPRLQLLSRFLLFITVLWCLLLYSCVYYCIIVFITVLLFLLLYYSSAPPKLQLLSRCSPSGPRYHCVYYCIILQPSYVSSVSQGSFCLLLYYCVYYCIIVFITVLFSSLCTDLASLKVLSFPLAPAFLKVPSVY